MKKKLQGTIMTKSIVRITVFVILTMSVIATAIADDSGAAPKTYALVSMVGDRLTFVTRRPSTGTSLDNNLRRTEPVGDDTMDAAALQSMQKAVNEVAPGSKTELLQITWPLPRGTFSTSSEEALNIARTALKEIASDRAWDFVVVLGPRRTVGEAHRLGSKLDGLGFYVDPGGPHRNYRPQEQPDNKVSSDRFISPYAALQLWLLNAKTLEVIASQPIYGYCRYANAKAESDNPWQFFPPQEMLEMLKRVVDNDVAEGARSMMRKGLGMAEVAPRGHVEFCTYRFE